MNEVWVVEVQRKNKWVILHHCTEKINATNTMRDVIELGHERKNTVRICKYIPEKINA